jgi:hypothetical protein
MGSANQKYLLEDCFNQGSFKDQFPFPKAESTANYFVVLDGRRGKEMLLQMIEIKNNIVSGRVNNLPRDPQKPTPNDLHSLIVYFLKSVKELLRVIALVQIIIIVMKLQTVCIILIAIYCSRSADLFRLSTLKQSRLGAGDMIYSTLGSFRMGLMRGSCQLKI